MKKILLTFAVLILIATGCSKKDDNAKLEDGKTQKEFFIDEAFKNVRSYNFTKSIIDNSIPYAQMICINPHCILNISNINPLKSKILKHQQLFKPDDITTESKNDLPTEYVTSYFEFDDRGFIVKQVSFKYYIFNGDIHPKTWYARKFNLTDYGIEATDWEEGILTDKYTIGFEKNFDSLEVKVHNQLSSIIYKDTIDMGSSKNTYYPDEEKYRIDYNDEKKDYYIYENGVPVKYTIGDYLYYYENDVSTRINTITGEKERKPEVFEWQRLPCGLVSYKAETTDDNICNYNVCYYGILDDYDDEGILLSMYMPLEKPEE